MTSKRSDGHGELAWSVVVPAYSPGPALGIALDSVFAAMGSRSDFEVVVVDDRSPVPIELGSHADRVKLVRNEVNVGAVRNFNRALAQASGEYVHLLHADDFVHADFYRALEAGLRDASVVAAATSVQRVDRVGRVIETMKPETASAGIWVGAFDRLAIANRLPAASVVARRSTYERIGGFDESLSHAADWDMWVRVAAAGPIYYDPRPLAAYRIHADQHTASVVASGHNIAEAVEVIKRLPERVDERRKLRSLMRRAYGNRVVYALRTAGSAARVLDLRTTRAQLGQAAHCAMLAASTVIRPPA